MCVRADNMEKKMLIYEREIEDQTEQLKDKQQMIDTLQKEGGGDKFEINIEDASN